MLHAMEEQSIKSNFMEKYKIKFFGKIFGPTGGRIWGNCEMKNSMIYTSI
jgi:hypothetical protein